MKILSYICATAAAIGVTTIPVRAEKSVYFGLTLLDPITETRKSDTYVLVDNGKIVRIGHGKPPASIPSDRRHDFSGRFVMPGLFDSHAHLTLGPVVGKKVDGKPVLQVLVDDAYTRHDARMLLAHGVTTIRDPGGDTRRMVAYRDAAAAGRIVGPEARVAGQVINRSEVRFENLVDQVSDAEPIDRIVKRQVSEGVDYVKLYDALTPADIAVGAATAHKAGRKAIAHLGDVSWVEGVKLGVDALVHAMPISPDLLPEPQRAAYLAKRRPGAFAFFEWFEVADLDAPEMQQMIALLAKRKIWLDATMIAFKLAFWGDDLAYRDRDVAIAHPAMVENWRTLFRFDTGWTADDYRRAKAVWPKVLRLVRMLHDAGVPMTIGTDMNNPFVAPGASLPREMALHADAGIPNWSILRMATAVPARLMGLEHRTGRLKPGLDADMLILDADPSRDIAAITQVAAVVENGRLHDPAELKRSAGR